MKKFCHISLSVLLSATILLIGTGVDVVRCAHSGAVKVMSDPCMAMGDMDCGQTAGCMTVEHVQLSPMDIAPTAGHDFHAVQPLIAVLPVFVDRWFHRATVRQTASPIRVVSKGPPRDYLNFIQVLLI